MIGFTIVALFKANAVPTLVRLYLINLLFAGLIGALTAIFILITSAVHVIVDSADPRPQYLCKVYLWVSGIYINSDTTLEPGSILAFHPGHCYLQQEDYQQVECCSHCP